MDRDPKWKDVRGGISDFDGSPRLVIEVLHEDKLYGAAFLFSVKDKDYPRFFGMVLDRMVKKIDKALDE